MKLPISVIVLTKNEEIHIKRCLERISKYVEQVFVIDANSSDETVKIAKKFPNVQVIKHQFINYSRQLNWALKNCQIKTDWILRLDADEYLEKNLIKYLRVRVNNLEQNISGIYIRRKVIYRGRWIRWGGFYPTWLLRIFRYQKAICETRHMDEHIKILSGRTIKIKNNIVDHNLNSLSFWTQKHDWYATREAVDYITQNRLELNKYNLQQDHRRRWLKNRIYNQAPLFLRVYLYYFFRYIVLLGFLDGLAGLQFHFLQCFWYRFLVDAKIYEIKQYQKKHRTKLADAVNKLYQYRI